MRQPHHPADPDPTETDEWRHAFDSLVQSQGPKRAQQILEALSERARLRRVDWAPELSTPPRAPLAGAVSSCR